jgi:hypothetical protein
MVFLIFTVCEASASLFFHGRHYIRTTGNHQGQLRPHKHGENNFFEKYAVTKPAWTRWRQAEKKVKLF